jgi:hypothetical protein
MRFFIIKVVWPNKPVWAPDKNPKIFSILVSNLLRYSTIHAFRVFSVYVQICSAYSQYTSRFIPSMLIIQTDSVRIFSEYTQQNSVKNLSYSAYSVYMHRLLRIFSVYNQIYSPYYQYTQRFVLRIRQMHPTDFEYSDWNYFFHSYKGKLLQKTVCKCGTEPKTQKE